MHYIKSTAIITLSAIFHFTNPAVARPFYSHGASPDTIGSISITINDEAKDACWTNLREVREYAEEKISSKRYNLVPENGNYDFVISLNAFRQGSICVGSYDIQIIKITTTDGVLGFHEIGDLGGVATQSDFNKVMIEAVQDMTNEM